MSSNSLHITRANYEEYFLLYVDGELTPEQCDAVEAFATLHPDLQEELDVLLTTKLDAETISFDKASLMADQMKANVFDENLLLYIDNELVGENKAAVEKSLATDPVYQYQHKLLLQTKLPQEHIIYPHKNELYRKAAPAIRPVIWFRAAAAIFVVLAMGFMWWMSQDMQQHAPVAVQRPAILPPSKEAQQPAPKEDNAALPVAPNEHDEADISNTTTALTSEHPEKNHSAEKVNMHLNQPAPAVSRPVVDQPIAAVDLPAEVERIEIINKPQHIINRSAVTTPPVIAYNSIETATNNNSAVEDVAATETNDKKGSLKGFLRKATRLIERRTGINPTNDDEELLIGALAIKLK